MTLMTETARPSTAPLVVRVLPAHRRFVLLRSSWMTMQPSARDSASARSTTSLIARPPARR
jgi:hypothetical protein